MGPPGGGGRGMGRPWPGRHSQQEQPAAGAAPAGAVQQEEGGDGGHRERADGDRDELEEEDAAAAGDEGTDDVPLHPHAEMGREQRQTKPGQRQDEVLCPLLRVYTCPVCSVTGEQE